ncbi:structural cement protein Gp24 [Rhodanobacter hydrolyticus]|uniref:DUF2190 family protein n=1 Tax=Rhodanobacter hydrolyticus TaxID=2250595 RepID=A0ABW8J703_9GAMM
MTSAAFQSTVNVTLGFGVVGELILKTPHRADSLTIDSNGGTIGNFFTKSNTTGVATQGGTIASAVVAAGFLVNPKVYASVGDSGGTLDPTLTLPAYSQGEFLKEGDIVVALTGAGNIGDQVQYNETTGVLSAVAPGGSATTGNALISGAVVTSYTSAAGLVSIHVNLNA